MSKSIRNLLLLLVTAVVLGGVYFLMSSRSDPRQTGVLYRLEDGESVENIQIQNAFGQFEFAREGEAWVVRSDGQYRTNPEKMELMISNLELLPITRVLDDSLPEYGLENPEAQVVFTTGSGEENRFSVGAETASKSGVYIRDDKTGAIMITSTGAVSQLTGSLAAYRAKDVLTIPASAIRQVTYYKDGQPVFTAANTNFKDWVLTAPFEAPARTIPLNELVTSMRSWLVAGYPGPGEDDMAAMGLKNPAQALVITDEAGNTQRLEFGSGDGTTTYVRTGEGDEIVKLYTVDLDFSDLEPNKLVFIAPLKTAIDDTKSVTLEYQGERAEFQLDHSVSPPTVTYNGAAASYNDFASLFSKYVGLNADGRDPATGTGRPVFTFTSVLTDGSTRELQLLERDGESYTMGIDGKTEYYLEAQKVEELLYRMAPFQKG